MVVVTSLIADRKIDSDKMMFEGIDTSAKPLFLVSEMAKVFFGRTQYWVRWVEGCQYVNPKTGEGCSLQPVTHPPALARKHLEFWKLSLDGQLTGIRRTDKKARIYTLGDIELMAHALASNGAISVTQLHQTLGMLQIQGEMYKFL